MIYQTVTEQDFIRAFDDVGRGNQFSPLARRVLFEYLDDISEDIGDIHLDPIAICCEWCEFTADELFEQYGDRETEYYHYVIDRDEKGIFRAHFDKVSPVTGGLTSTPYRVTERDFMAGEDLEGINPYDGAEIAEEVIVTPKTLHVLNEEEDCDALEELIESMQDYGQLLRVEHYGSDDTYLVSEG